MEVLLLDTTEKEGEDNTLYHYVHSSDSIGCFSSTSPSSKPNAIQWLDLRGVLAAAVGATTSLSGEALQFARFGGEDTNVPTGVVGFVNLYEVLYVLVFSFTDLPASIVQYYTRSSCDLLLSFFGYPDAKLDKWRRRDGSFISTATLTTQLHTVFRGIFSVIQKDWSFGSHLQFAFDGRVPAVNYSLETMAKLAVLDMPFSSNTTQEQKFSTLGRSIFYRWWQYFLHISSKQLVFSTMRNDFLRMIFQWFLHGDHFTPDSSVTTDASDGSSTRLDTFELHDFRFTRHGEYPKRHAFLIITHGNLTMVVALERKLELEGDENAFGWAKQFGKDVDQHCIENLASFCDQHLEAYLEDNRMLRRQREETLATHFSEELQREPESPIHDPTPSQFLWYSVGLDRLRGVILGDELCSFAEADHNYQHRSIMALFVQYVSAYQQRARCLHNTLPEPSPEVPSGIPPLNLDVDDPDTLFLTEKPTDEGSADISIGDAHIFPQSHNLQYTKKNGRTPRQTAERINVCGQPLWIIVNSYEALEFFSILDAALPVELLEHEMNRLCAFGGAQLADAVDSEN